MLTCTLWHKLHLDSALESAAAQQAKDMIQPPAAASAIKSIICLGVTI